MKKKGRICGTIGFILSLALAGGTVVYGTMFHDKTVGKAEKSFGASTGSVIDGWSKKTTGFDNTKKLVDESSGIFNGTAAEYGTYKSYTVSFTVLSSTAQKTGNKEKTTVAYREGVVYSDADYTYLKLTTRTMEGRTVNVSAGEYVLAKESNVWYMRTNVSTLAETPEDGLLLDKAKWTATAESGFVDETDAFFLLVSDAFENAVQSASTLYISPFGEQYFNVKKDDTESECRFTVGTCPTVRYSYTTEKPEGDGVYGNYSLVLNYSGLNNTNVDLPKTLEEAMK